jgi:hypothetical protein
MYLSELKLSHILVRSQVNANLFILFWLFGTFSACQMTSTITIMDPPTWRATFRGCVMQGRKTAKGSKGRIEH